MIKPGKPGIALKKDTYEPEPTGFFEGFLYYTLGTRNYPASCTPSVLSSGGVSAFNPLVVLLLAGDLRTALRVFVLHPGNTPGY